MNRIRVSIAGIMVFVLVSALGVAALRSPTPLWAGGVFTLALAGLGLAAPGMLYRKGGRRAFWVGFAAFGWGYWIVSLSPWVGEVVQPRLITTFALQDMRDRLDTPVIGGPRFDDVLQREFEAMPQVIELSAAKDEMQAKVDLARTQVQTIGDAAFATYKKLDAQLKEYRQQYHDLQLKLFPSLRRRLNASSTAGPEADERFQRIGHSLFALLSGLLGGMIAVRFHQTRDTTSCPDDERSPSSPSTT